RIHSSCCEVRRSKRDCGVRGRRNCRGIRCARRRPGKSYAVGNVRKKKEGARTRANFETQSAFRLTLGRHPCGLRQMRRVPKIRRHVRRRRDLRRAAPTTVPLEIAPTPLWPSGDAYKNYTPDRQFDIVNFFPSAAFNPASLAGGSVLVTPTVFLLAQFAVRRRQTFVDAMFHSLYRPQIGKHSLQIII